MNHTEFFKSLKSGEIAPVYFFVGEEGYVLKSALKQLISSVVAEDMREVNLTLLPGDTDGQQIVEACETFPFFTDKRMVVVEECGFVNSQGKPENEDRFLEYLKNPMESTVLVITSSKPDKRKRAYKDLCAHTVVEFNVLSDSELMAWIEKILRGFNLNIERNALLFLIEYAEARPQSLICELEKLAFYKKEGVITKQDVLEIVTPSNDYNVFNMTDALLRKDTKTALSLLSYMLSQKEEPIMILGAISKQYRNALMFKTLKNKNAGRQDIIKILDIRDFVYKKLENSCAKQTEETLNKAVELCFKTDEGLKTGKLFDESALHALVTQITLIK